ncbi:MAG: AAA family ATPase [Thiomargarita sp.]|nr:AAA family ATPase [Thiomargarita sp.]
MYIKEMVISEYKILNDLKIQLQPPSNSKNIVNVIAGINGTGKTSLLESIVKGLAGAISPENIHFRFDEETEKKRHQNADLQKLRESFEKRQNISPKVIYIASYLIDVFMPVTQLDTEYHFINQLESVKILGNAEYYIREYILAHERNSYEGDPVKRTREAIDNFNQHFQEANLLTQLYDLDGKHFNRPVFKQKGSDMLISIDCLSDGERQLYGLIVALMILNPSNSIILIDEPELALHPAWQQIIMSIYTKIGQNNQFIVATHSPQIIARTPINNLIFLRKNSISHKIEAIYPKQHQPKKLSNRY